MRRRGDVDGEREHVERVERVRALEDAARVDSILGPLRRHAVERDEAHVDVGHLDDASHDGT